MLKSRGCGDLRAGDAGANVTLAGWVHRRRDHGGLIFIDLRDRSGLVQVVFNPGSAPDAHRIAEDWRGEWVVRLSGVVAMRPKGTENPRIATGDVEVLPAEAQVLSPAKTPPFYINEDTPVDEALRLEYRYLDLRKDRMQRNLDLRHRVIKYIRDFLDARGFIEVETPVLIKSTPEGARDYLVPSRISPGAFYALPQSPQQLKQLLMVAGLERYYQIARCFRDEDLRADRQPEFTQLDLEMSFVEEKDILDLMEELFTALVEAVTPEFTVTRPVPRMTYAQAMDRYGTDKPDLRFGLELAEISDLAAETELGVFRTAIEQGGTVKGFAAPGCGEYTRKQLDELTEIAKERGAKGLVTIALGAVAKFLTLDQVKEIARRLGGRPGDLLLIVAGEPAIANAALGHLRQVLGAAWGSPTPAPSPLPLSSISRCWSGSRTRGAGTRCITPLPLSKMRTPRCWMRRRRGCAPRRMTWSATATSSPAEASASMTWISRPGSSSSWATRRSRSRSGSAICSGRSSTGSRPTEASPTASTAW